MRTRTRSLSVLAALVVIVLAVAGCSAAPAASTPASVPAPAETARSAAPSETATAAPAPVTAPVTALKVEDKVMGTGPGAKSGDVVIVDYTGWLTDGTKFDSSIDAGRPFEFAVGLGEVIPGWDQGIVGMKANGVRMLTIPPDLAYGATGAGGVIPPNATLVFEVKLLQIN